MKQSDNFDVKPFAPRHTILTLFVKKNIEILE